MLKRILKNGGIRQAAIYGSAIGLTKGISFLMVPVFTQYLEPADYGRLDVLQTLADLLSIVIGMGLADTLFRFSGGAVSEQERKREAAEIFGFAVIVGVVSAILAQLAAPTIRTLLPGDASLIQVRLILASLSFSAIILVPLAWLRMRDRAGLYFFSSAGRAVFQAGLAALLLSIGFGVTGVLAAGCISATGLATIMAVAQLRATGIRFSFSALRKHGAYGGPLVFAGMAGFVLGSFDRILLADAIGTAEMAEYALAAKFGLITGVLIQPFDMWWMPRRFAVLKEEDGAERSARSVIIGITIAVAAALSVAIGGPAAVRLLTPESYHGAVAYIPWLAGLAALHSCTALVNVGCYTQKTTAWPLLIDSSAAAIAFTGYLILIPRFGTMGAIYATAAALSYRFLFAYTVSQRQAPLPHNVFKLLGLALFAVAGLSLITRWDFNLIESAAVTVSVLALLGVIAVPMRILPNPFTTSTARAA